jgi:hypothetical protein
MYRHRKSFALIAVVALTIVPAFVFAAMPTQIVTCTGVTGANACTVCDIARTAQNVLNIGIYIAVFMSAILFAYAGIIYVTNIANHGEISKAKSIFSNVVVGLVIILASWLVIDTLMKTLISSDVTERLGPWNRVC